MNINMKSKTIKNRDLQIAIAVFLAGLSCFGLLYYYQALLPDLVEYFKINKAKTKNEQIFLNIIYICWNEIVILPNQSKINVQTIRQF